MTTKIYALGFLQVFLTVHMYLTGEDNHNFTVQRAWHKELNFVNIYFHTLPVRRTETY
jgi:hypothetical protein